MAIGAVIAAATAVLVVALAPAAIIRLVAIIIMDSLVVDHLAAAAVTSVHWRVVVLLLFNHGNVSIAARVRVSMINDVPLSRWHHHQRRWSTWPVASIHHAMLDAH